MKVQPELLSSLKQHSVVTVSGTSTDIPDIPAWAKRITLSIMGLSGSGTSNLILQIGDSGGIEISGYLDAASMATTSGATIVNPTNGFGLTGATANQTILHGHVVLTLGDPQTNTWVASVNLGNSNTTQAQAGGGSKSLSDVLDRLRLTTAGGSDTLDAGKVGVLIEG